MAYQYVPDQTDVVYPARIQQIADEYKRHKFNYTGPDPDHDMESWKELGFEERKIVRPDSYYMNLLSLYRLHDEYSNDEWMLWKVEKWIKDNNDKKYRIEVVMGRRPELEVDEIKDENTGKTIDKLIRGWNMVYTEKWNPTTFDNIVNESKSKRFMLQIARPSAAYWIPYTGTPILIKDAKLFRNATYDELVEHDRRLEAQQKALNIKSLGK